MQELAQNHQSLAPLGELVRANFAGLKRQMPLGTHIVLLRDDAEQLSVVAHSSRTIPANPSLSIPLESSFITPRIFSARCAMVFDIPEFTKKDEFEFIKQFDIKSMIAAPLMKNDKPAGIVMVARAESASSFTQADITDVERVAQKLGYMLQQPAQMLVNKWLFRDMSAIRPLTNKQ